MFVAQAPGRPAKVEPPPPDLADTPLELIERQIEELAAHINAGCARWLELVAEFDRREGWGGTGCRSTSEWVAWRCALNPRSAREHVRVARALPELPRIRAAFASGALSYSKVRALTRIADADSEADLLELARHATAAQLERMVRAARRVTTAEALDQQRESFLRWSWDDEDGTLRIEAKLPPDDGALFLRALEAARDALYDQRRAEAEEERGGSAEPHHDCDEPSSCEQAVAVTVPSPSNAQSLAAVAEAALARPPTGLPGGERYQVFVHVDAPTLAGDAAGECAIADGPGIAPETARRLTCDCSLITILERDGEPLSVGRRTRSIPPAMKRALIVRDGHCQFPGCERHRFVDAHHVKHWAHGGKTSLSNLVLLCRHHHRLVHEGGFSVTVDSRERRGFRRPDGSTIEPAPSLRVDVRASRRWARAPLLTGSGERMDLASCVDAVLTARAARGAGAPG